MTDIMVSGRTLDTLTSLATDLTNSVLQGLNQLFTPSGNITSSIVNLFDPLKIIPLAAFYISLPAIFIGVAILIRKFVGPEWFKMFKSGNEEEEEGGGWGSPSPAYGLPVPSSAYGQPGSSTNSRQTAILESIDNLNHQYGHPPGQPSMPTGMNNNNNAADYTSEDAQNYMTYYYNQPQVPQQPSTVNTLNRYR